MAKQMTTFVCGLDLGQSADFTALCVAEQTEQPDPAREGKILNHYAVRHLKRWPLRTPYPQIVADVAKLVEVPPLAGALLAVDQTGVGAAVIDMFRLAALKAKLTPILITAGHETTRGDDGAWHVPKKELVSVLQVLLQTQRLKVANLPERKLLLKELQLFKVKVTAAGSETFEAWRERDHDDLVLAVALACWHAERPQKKVIVY